MKIISTILLTLIFCGTAFAQPSELKRIETGLEEGKDNMSVSSLFELINVDKDQFFNQNKIEGGTIYAVRNYGSYQKLAFATTWFDFTVLMDNSTEKVLYSTVAISGVKSPNKDDIFQQYHNSFAKHVKAHEKKFGVKINLEDEDMSPLNSFTFGTGCGWNGPLPEKGMKMFELIKSGDQTTLMNWVKSMNPSIQAYGVMGLHFLKKKGKTLTLKKKDKKVLGAVKSQKTVIDYCSNIDLNATTPMNMVLSDFYLDSIWELYKNSKYLR